VFDTVDTLLVVLPALAGTVATMQVDGDRLKQTQHRKALHWPTDVAEWLGPPRCAVPRMRTSGRSSCRVWCTVHDVDLGDVSTRTSRPSRRTSPRTSALCSRSRARWRPVRSFGGTAPARVAEQLAALREVVAEASVRGRAVRPAERSRRVLPRSFYNRPVLGRRA